MVSILLSVHPLVCPICQPLQQHAACLPLGAEQAGNINQLLHGTPGARHPAAMVPQQQMSVKQKAEHRLADYLLGVLLHYYYNHLTASFPGQPG